MGWNPFKRRASWDALGEKSLTGTPAVLDAIRSNWTPYPLLGGGSRQRILEVYNTAKTANYAWMYRRSPAVRVVIDCLVRNLGQLDLRLYEEISESERKARPDHPAALSLRYPNETSTGAKWRRSMFKDFLITDDAFSVMLPAPGRQLNLQWVPAHMVEIQGSSLFMAERYRVWRRDGTWVDFEPAQMLHWHGENPEDPRTGLSHLETLRDVVAEDAALQQAVVELANAGMTEPAWVFRPADAPAWSNDARDGFEEDLANRLRRSDKRPVVLEEGMEMRSFGVSPKDAEMMDLRKWAISQVAREYGVPLGMIGLADNLEEARAEFYADTLPPYCEDFSTTLNQRVLVRVYDWTDGCFEFNLDEKHMGDDRLKALVSATGRPVMLTDEARAMLNLPPVPGGDELITPRNVIEGSNPQPSVDVVNPADPNGQPRGVGYDQEPKALAKAPGYEIEPTLHPGRKAELERQHRAIDAAQAVVARHLNRMERSLRAKSAPTTNWDKWDREFSSDLHKALEAIVEAEGGLYTYKLGGGDFDSRRVKNYVRAMAEGAAEAINQKMRDTIDADGLDAAFAHKAAHVESAGASLGAGGIRFAREEAARQSPDLENRVKTWVPNTNRHAAYGGQTVPLGAQWPAGFAPGGAPGCRCTMAIN